MRDIPRAPKSGPMTPESRRLVQQSWREVLPAADHAADVFYERLLRLDPQLARSVRTADAAQRRREWTRGVTEAVHALPVHLAPPPCAAAGPDAAHGFENPHYATLGMALLAALEETLRARFTAPVAAAWVDCYRHLAPGVRRAALGEPGLTRIVPLHSRVRLIEIGS